jgi:hypothetical protein
MEESLYVQVHIDTAVNAPWWYTNAQEMVETGRWGGWFNTKPGSVYQVYRVKGTTSGPSGNGTQTTRWNGSDIGPGIEGLFHFQVDLKRKVYSFAIPGPLSTRPTVMHRESVQVTPGEPPYRQDLSGPIMGNGTWKLAKLPDHPLPASGMNLRGQLRIPYESRTIFAREGDPPLEAILQWTFSPKPPTPLKLEIEATPDGGMPYAQWRPKPGPDERTPGSFLKVTARLVTPPGAPPEKAAVIRLLLTDVSEERGVSLNYPWGAETRDPIPDFEFDPSYNREVGVDGRRAHVAGNVAERGEIVAGINFFDGGAWGELMAEAEMQDGRYVLGHVKGHPEQRTLLIPQRRPDSKIADMWRSPGADDDDADSAPTGDGQPGDGLTNYEEYRGFHVQFGWTEGDPDQKDFFVRNKAGGMAVGGIRLFETASGLRVHRLAPGELPATKVINAARTVGPHNKNQHGVIIRHDPALGNICKAVMHGPPETPPGMPVHVDYVGLGAVPNVFVTTVNFATGQTNVVNYGAATVAHELFHCCNVYHHGDPLSEAERTWEKMPDGSITENGTPIRVVNEAGQDVSGQIVFDSHGQLVTQVFVKGGKASGDVSCIMRYDVAWATEDPARPQVRVVLAVGSAGTGEMTGSRLCTGSAGLGNTRFGPAPRGNCVRQIVVNDDATRTSR